MTKPTKPISEIFGKELLIFDGAMGTELYRHHIFTNRSYEELCLSDPKLIEKIFSSYIDAGADVLTTNTFGANRVALAKHGLSEKTLEINRAGVELARRIADASERPIYVAGDIGPMPRQPRYRDQLDEMVLELVDCLMDAGADFILFETIPNRAGVEQLANAMRARPKVPYLISMVMVDHSGRDGTDSDSIGSADGETLSKMLAPLSDDVPPPIGLGFNCGMGPSGLLRVLEEAVTLTDLPLVVMPNAGMPKEVEDRRIYLSSPEYVATYAQRYARLGAAGIGGCCGIGPEHIHEIVMTVKSVRQATAKAVTTKANLAAEPESPTPLENRSELGHALATGQWITSVELLPPKGYDLSDLIAKSKTLEEHGITAVNIPDGPRASSRISPLVACAKIRQETRIEPVLHFCCRDRNLIGMQSDLLACAACDIHNILFITGDPPKLGDYPHSTGVFDTDAIGIAALQSRLNQGIELGGQSIRPKTEAVIGVGLDPTALDRQRELDRFRQKVDAGAEFAITQPVFDPEALLRVLDEIESLEIPVIAGVWPLASYRNATFMNNEVPGVDIPDSIMRRMEAQETREGQLAEGIRIAQESVARIRGRVAGIQVSAPFGRVETALTVIENG